MAAAGATSHATSPFPSNRNRPCHPHTRILTVRCSSSRKTVAPTAAVGAGEDPSPAFKSVTAFAPATVANLGPGFDFLGCAVADADLSLGDTVTAAADPSLPGGCVTISSISGASRLSRDATRNCAGIAAAAVMRHLGVRSTGVSLSLSKGLPLGSGLGSSAASAAAAAAAVNHLFGRLLSLDALVLAGLESEETVSGRHADNIAPAILGGFVLVRGCDPVDLIHLHFPDTKNLHFVLVSPDFEAPTRMMRAKLPSKIPMKDHVHNSRQAAALVAAIARGDVAVLGSALSSDGIVEPTRAPLIPGMAAVKKAALEAGALGCTISGAGPTAVAVIEGEEGGEEIGARMVDAFLRNGGLKARATVARLDRAGARVISTSSLG